MEYNGKKYRSKLTFSCPKTITTPEKLKILKERISN
jgi:hypothetical protein